MPFRASCVMDQRLRFVSDCRAEAWSMAALCEAYGISRETGYKWLARYRAEGPAGLVDRSRAPHRPAHGMAPALVEATLALRRERPHWGPKKLKAQLERERPELVWPAASTIGDLLKRRGLITARRRHRSGLVPACQVAPEATVPNDRLAGLLTGAASQADRPPAADDGASTSRVGSAPATARAAIP